MNIEETKKAIEVMQAFVDGKTVRCTFRGGKGNVVDISRPIWDWSTYEYLIKPEPKEMWVNEYPSGDEFNYRTPIEAANALNAMTGKTVHYREVIEE